MPVHLVVRFLVAAMLLIGVSFAAAEPIRIATFNVYWLFDDEPPHQSWGERRDPQTYDQAIGTIAAAIATFSADVVGLQEIEGPKITQDLVAALADRGHTYNHAWTGQGMDPFTGQDVAVLSKFPAVIDPILRYPGVMERFYTDQGFPRIAILPTFMRVDLEVGSNILTFFVAHLKSQIGGYTAERERLAQAQMVRRIVRAPLEKGRPNVVLMGDLNDDNGTQTLNTLIGRTDGSWPLYQSTASDLFAGEAWTHDHDGEREQLDHVLLSKFLNDCLRTVEIQRFDERVSDHAAVVVEVELGC